MDSSQIDNLFLGILQNCGQIEPFLDIVFSFLARRTDFFRVLQNKDEKMGFPEGFAEKMVLETFKKYQRFVSGSSSQEKGKKVSKTKKTKTTKKSTTSEVKLQHKNNASPEQQNAKAETEKSESSQESKNESPKVVASTVEVSSSDVDQNATQEPVKPVEQVVEAHSCDKPSPHSDAPTSSASTTTESTLLEPGKHPDCYNGAVLDKYTWSQTIKDLDIKVPVPKCIQRARDVSVEIKSSSLKVSLKGNIPSEELKTESNVLVDGKLQRTVKCEESLWSLEPGKCILINLEKTEERFWTTVCEGDLEIDRTKVDSTRNIDDFDEQTQSDFQQVMFDHHQKNMGKPTSKEQKTHNLLEKAWNAKGSPFAGTPFDPSQVNISS